MKYAIVFIGCIPKESGCNCVKYVYVECYVYKIEEYTSFARSPITIEFQAKRLLIHSHFSQFLRKILFITKRLTLAKGNRKKEHCQWRRGNLATYEFGLCETASGIMPIIIKQKKAATHNVLKWIKKNVK